MSAPPFATILHKSVYHIPAGNATGGERPAGGISTTKERIYIYPKPENWRRSRAAPQEAFSGEVLDFYVLYKISLCT
ncbi:MAG: hypothetical protein K2P26_12465, partial [Oscillospiraceae bacterium]|nr:hypothetical protein [Oscillospiraceae bacterium]